MMDSLFRASNHIIFKIIMILIIISLIIMGIGGYLVHSYDNYVAKVNGQKITYTELNQEIQNIYNHQREYIVNKNSHFLNNERYLHELRQQALTQLIDKTLLEQYIHKLGLTITNNQIKQTIFSTPNFHINNQFDNNKFYSFIHKIGLTTQQYILLVQKQLLYQQLMQGLGNTDFLLPNERDCLLSIALQIRTVRLLTFNISVIANQININPNEIFNFYNTHKNQFVSQDKFKISYIPLNTDILKKNISINGQEIKMWYNKHHNQFTIPTKKHYRIIQTKTRNDAEICLKQLQKGIKFTNLAKSKSIDIISAKHGGDIGWVSDSNSIKEIKQANLYKIGQLSRIIKSSIGFLIIRLDDIKPSYIKPLNLVVQKEIQKKIKEKKSIDNFYYLKNKINNAIYNNKTLKYIEHISGIHVKQTQYFNYNKIPVELNYSPIRKTLMKVSSSHNNTNIRNNISIVNINNHCAFVIYINDHKKATIKPLKKVYKQIQNQLKKYEAIKQARFNANKTLFDIRDHWKEHLPTQGIGIYLSKQINFISIKQNTPLIQNIFNLPQPKVGESSYGIADDINGNPVLIILDKVTPLLLNNKQRNLFLKQLNQSMIDITFSVLLANLHTKANIQVNKKII